MKTNKVKLFLFCIMFGIGQITTSYAGKEVGVVVHRPEEGDTNFGHAVDISGKTFIASYTSYVGDHGGVYIFAQKAKKWDVINHFKTPDGKARDWFGWDVAIDGDIAVIGAYEDGGRKVVAGGPLGEGPGAVYAYRRQGKGFGKKTQLKANDAADKDRFGFAVDVSGNTLIVGAPNDDDAGSDSGSAYVYILDGDKWKKQTKLVATDAAAKQWFGWDVAIDGNTIVVGAPLDKEKGRNAGAAYIFVREGVEWKQQAKLVATDGDSNDKFGNAVDISQDSVVIGTPKDEEKGKDTGAAYVFLQSGDNWTEEQKLLPSTSEVKGMFGHAVAIADDMAVVGAPLEDGVDVDAGAAYTFLRRGGEWVETKKVASQKLKKGEDEDLTTGDNFGNAIAVDKRVAAARLAGQLFVAIGSRWDNVAGNNDRGSVYVYNAEADLGMPLSVDLTSDLLITKLGHIKWTVLLQNFPNPFNPETWFPYTLAEDSTVTFLVHDMNGRLVRQLEFGQVRAGSYLDTETAAYWDGISQSGERVSSGVYYYTLQSETHTETRKMILLK